MAFSVHELSQHIGARVETDKDTLVGGVRCGELRELLEKRGVLVFPAVHLTDEEQLAFARTLGDIVRQGERGIYKVTLDAKITPTAEYLHGTVLWHFDGWADDVPARGSILSARVLSPVGGQTEFANTYAAYEALPEEKKKALAGVHAFHTMQGTQRYVTSPTADIRAGWARYTPKRHPLVWAHRSGRKSLLLGSSADWVEGMDQGRALLAELEEWATRPRFVYRHEWQLGDMLMWDNCGALHRVMPYAADSGRMMHRVTLVGEEAIA
jgi:alpha-ketoglutarate-dependent taurine dioxygenase